MFSIYVKNYISPDTLEMVTDEVLFYEIPSDYSSDKLLIDPKITVEMGKAGSFEFKMQPNNPMYNSFRQMKTIMRVTYGEWTLFRGRVLTIDNTMYGEKSIHLEGDLAFLLDSYQEAVLDEHQIKKSLETYLPEVISAHNSMVEDDKKFALGKVPGQYDNSVNSEMRVMIDASIDDPTKKYNSNNWTQTMNALDSLSGQYGGYWRTRYSNGTAYLDWLKCYFNPIVNDQPMRVGSNLIDISDTLEVNNIFTAIIPIGTRKGKSLYLTNTLGRKYMKVSDILQWYTDEELTETFHKPSDYENADKNYGWIYKTVQFSNADTEDTLFKYAKDWIKNNYHGGISSFTVSALDLKMAGENVNPYLVGDLVEVIYPDPVSGNEISGTYVCMKISYDLYNPENNQYTVGIPDMALNKTYGETKTTRGSAGISPTKKASDNTGDMGGLLDGISDDQEQTKYSFLHKMWIFMDTGEWPPDDDGESKTDNTTTPNDDKDEADQNDFWSLLRGDGIKSKLFDAVKGNFNDVLTVGGSNTLHALEHMAGSVSSGDWSESSPIILDGSTGDIVSKRGHAVFQSIDIGSLDNVGTIHNLFWVDSLGNMKCYDQAIFGTSTFHDAIHLCGQHSSIAVTDPDAQGASVLLTPSGTVRVGNVKAAHYYVRCQDDVTNVTDIATSAFTDVSVTENNGLITFKFWGPKQNPSTDTPIKTVNFNMAATQFYIDAVAAAKEEGRQEGGAITFSNITASIETTPQNRTKLGNTLNIDNTYHSIWFNTSNGRRYYIQIDVT